MVDDPTTIHKVRTRIYVAGPISQGDPVSNCQRAIEVGFELMDLGYAPYVPHYSWFVDVESTYGKGRYTQWISLDFSWITVCRALLRLPGPSKGADREVKWAKRLGIPVYESVEALREGCDPVTLVQ